MSESTNSATSPPSAAGVSPQPLEGKALEMAERAKRGDLPGSVGGVGRGWVLLVLTVLWLAVMLWNASFGPARGFLGTAVVWGGAAVLALMWLGNLLWTVTRRRRPALVLVLAVPIALVLWAALPWSSWLFSARLSGAETELRALAEEHAWIGEGQQKDVNRTIGGIPVRTIYRMGGTMFLQASRASDGNWGLMYCPPGVTPPSDGREPGLQAKPIKDRWYSYTWANKN